MAIRNRLYFLSRRLTFIFHGTIPLESFLCDLKLTCLTPLALHTSLCHPSAQYSNQSLWIQVPGSTNTICKWVIQKPWPHTKTNRPFPSSLVPLFQSESKCKTILMKMTLSYMKKKLHAELIFIWKASHFDSFWNRGTRELGNGLLNFSLTKLESSLSKPDTALEIGPYFSQAMSPFRSESSVVFNRKIFNAIRAASFSRCLICAITEDWGGARATR